MAIKDQCAKCRNFGGEYCKHASAHFEFDQNSCIFYEKSTINLAKVDAEAARREYEARRQAALASDVAPSAVPTQDVPVTPAAPATYQKPVPVTPVSAPAAPSRPAPRPVGPAPSGGAQGGAGGNAAGNKTGEGMFAHPFSFEGRIQRTEYTLTYLLVYIACQIVFDFGGIGGFLFIALMWFWIAQSVKRCHDAGHSGLWLLIPFYCVYLVFAEGNNFENDYGPVPQG